MERAEQVSSPLRVVDGLTSIDRLEPLDGYHGELVAAIDRLLQDGVDALEVTKAVADVNDRLTTRLVELAEEGLGPAPFSYAWLKLGSQGRGEQVLSSDQDSALAYGGPRRADGDPANYFSEMAGRVVDGLARAGIRRCSGGFMATTWCHPLEQFTAQFHAWVDRPEPEALLRAEVFFDVRSVYGALPVDGLTDILVTGGGRGPFQAQMAKAAVTFAPPRTIFGRLRTDHGYLDAKRAGTAPIVLLARLYALGAGSMAHSTAMRLRDAGEHALGPQAAQQLTDAYRLLTGLRLRHQVEQSLRGEALDNRIRVDALSADDAAGLRDARKAVRVVQQATAIRFMTHIVA